MPDNANLQTAKNRRKDEFYTMFEDIEKEMIYYEDHFKDKVIFCNCDDSKTSNFWRYFHLNFKRLGLKKLIATHYEKDSPTYKIEYEGGNDLNTDIGKVTKLKGDGDFRSSECIEILKESDIVTTNVPFSLFREYILQLMAYDKKFIVIGSMNALKYKEIFPYIMKNEMWYGVSIHSGDRKFYVPDDYPLEASICGVDKTERKYIRVKGVRWYTNIDHKFRYNDLVLEHKYNSADYPKYDNYNAINVNKTKEIPYDYNGIMGVPITFMDKYNPEQFEIVGIFNHGSDNEFDLAKPVVNEKELYPRIAIKRRKEYKKPCMIIGNLKFEIEKDKEYLPEELADLIMKEPYGRYFVETLLRNQLDWSFLYYPCTVNIVDKQIYLRLVKRYKEDTLTEIGEIVSKNSVCSVEDDDLGLHLKSNKNKVNIAIIRNGDSFYMNPYIEDRFDSNKAITLVLELFFQDKEIKTSKDLRRVAEDAIKSYQMAVADKEDNPFVVKFD